MYICNKYVSELQSHPEKVDKEPLSGFILAGQRVGFILYDFGLLTESYDDFDSYVRFAKKDGDSIKDIFVKFDSKTGKYFYSVPVASAGKSTSTYKGMGSDSLFADLLSTNAIKNNMNPIYSFTLKELRDAEDMDFIHRREHLAELDEPELEYCYANTLVFTIKSSQYGKKDKKSGGTNVTKYKVFVLFEDFYTIGKDKDIDFGDAVDYAINYADAHIRCTCPSMLYHGFSFEGTSLRYLYGVPRENRFPKIRNPNLRGTMCKHCDMVVEWILKHKDIVTKLFATYYGRLNDGQSIYAVNTKGTTITIGKKNEDGDVFFEQQVEEENMSEDQTPEEQTEETTEEQDFDVMEPDTWMLEEEDNVTDTDEENE